MRNAYSAPCATALQNPAREERPRRGRELEPHGARARRAGARRQRERGGERAEQHATSGRERADWRQSSQAPPASTTRMKLTDPHSRIGP